MFRFRFASESEIAERKRLTLGFLGKPEAPRVQPHSQAAATPEPACELPTDLLSYLKLIAETPEMASTERDRQAHTSPKRGGALRAELLQRGLIYEASVSKGAGSKVDPKVKTIFRLQ